MQISREGILKCVYLMKYNNNKLSVYYCCDAMQSDDLLNYNMKRVNNILNVII